MANDLLNPPEVESTAATSSQNGHRPGTFSTGNSGSSPETGHELDAFLGRAFEEKSLWAALYENVHEAFFPTKLPPLELTSTPIPVPDRMAVKWSPAAWIIAAVANFAILAFLLFAFRNQINKVLPPKFQIANLDMDIKPYQPQAKKTLRMGGGGGGGSNDPVPPIKGHLPKPDPHPLLQPQVVVNEHPKLAVEPKIDIPNIKLPDNPNLPTIGVTNSPNVTLASNGPGSHAGMGGGTGGGIGPGNGNGLGPGSGGLYGGGVRSPGDGISSPKLIYSVEAEFSDEARRAKYEGTVVVSLIVDAQGNPQNVHTSRSLGMGLDEKAIEAVRQYKFKPSIDTKTGKAVPVIVNVEVHFRLY